VATNPGIQRLVTGLWRRLQRFFGAPAPGDPPRERWDHTGHALSGLMETGTVATRLHKRGFRKLVLARAMRSPVDLELENPSLVGGDLGGGSFELD
jgi:hypothetical protein